MEKSDEEIQESLREQYMIGKLPREDRPKDMEFKTKDKLLIAEVQFFRGDHVPRVGEIVNFQVHNCDDAWFDFKVTKVTTTISRKCDAPHIGNFLCFEIIVKPVGKDAREEIKALAEYWAQIEAIWTARWEAQAKAAESPEHQSEEEGGQAADSAPS